MIKQRTLKNIIRATGVGLHTGEKVYLTLRPAAPNTGVVFRRVDLAQPVDSKDDPYRVGDTPLPPGPEPAGGAGQAAAVSGDGRSLPVNGC